MPSSKREKPRRRPAGGVSELCDINQLGLDFVPAASYSVPPRKETEPMNQELIDVLETKIGVVLEKYNDLKEENAMLHDEIQRLTSDREEIKSRVDAILGKLDGF
jgi:predicted nuclease with TOPRIM domain